MNIIKKIRKWTKKLPWAKKDIYINQFDLEAEEEKFEKFCKQTSHTSPEDRINYSQWEDQTKQRISNKFTTREDMYNFKRHCEIKTNSIKSDVAMENSIIFAVLAAIITMILTISVSDPFWASLGEKLDKQPPSDIFVIIAIVPLIAVGIYILLIYRLLKKVNSGKTVEQIFYSYLISIIESCEKEIETTSNTLVPNNEDVLATVQATESTGTCVTTGQSRGERIMIKQKEKMSKNLKVMNLVQEIEEYKKYFDGKSDMYTCYSEWKRHIEQNLTSIQTKKECKDYERYIINKERTKKFCRTEVAGVISALIGACITLYVTNISENTDTILVFFVLLLSLGMGFMISKVIEGAHYQILEETYFYEDLLEIIKNYEERLKK